MSAQDVQATLRFWPAAAGDITTTPPRHYDMRTATDSYAPWGLEPHSVTLADARATPGLGLETSGFQLVRRASAVTDFLDGAEVMRTYYAECRQLACELTGASHAFTFDHLVREPGRQVSGGGTDGRSTVTGAAQGGGYVGAVHVDYTEHTTWDAYLAVHGLRPPAGARRSIALNFWRPVCAQVDNDPLGICDARTVAPADLYETVVHGYGADNYSWHGIGIETYNVKHAAGQRWFWYPGMRADEVLVFKSYDSAGVIGRACPHAAFELPVRGATPRRSIELRVLCYLA